MQRKLSEIAEIPKILSSTLVTVSQTFEKLNLNGMPSNGNYKTSGNEVYQLLQKRKLSYDEDAYDYELSDEEDGDDVDKMDEEFNAREAYIRLRQHVAAKQRKSKEVTPESDYVSENNYSINGSGGDMEASPDNDDEDEEDDDDDDEKANSFISNDDSCEKFDLRCFLTPLAHGRTDDTKAENVDDDDDEDDFLTTTFTWNLPNKSKLQRNSNDFTDSPTHVPQTPSVSSAACNGGGNEDADKDVYANVTPSQASLINNNSNNEQTSEDSSTKQPKVRLSDEFRLFRLIEY